MKYLINGGESNIFNLGNGVGFTVKEVIETERKVTGLPIKAVEEKRRAGVPDILIVSSDKAKEVLGWKPELNSLKISYLQLGNGIVPIRMDMPNKFV